MASNLSGFSAKKVSGSFDFLFYYTLAFLFGTGGFDCVRKLGTLPQNTKSNTRLETELWLLIRLCAFWRDSFQSFACFVPLPPLFFFLLTSVTELVVDWLHINRLLALEGREISDT